MTKVCSKCGIEYPIEMFYIRSESKDGHRADCKNCVKNRSKIYQEKHSEIIKIKHHQRYINNFEINREKYMAYKKKNREKIRNYTREKQHNFCIDNTKIENYEKAKADNFVNWERHHRLETYNSDGEKRLVQITPEELKALGVYYNRPAEELIYLTVKEHRILHKQ